MESRAAQNLLPRAVVDQVRSSSRNVFLASIDTPVLLVRVEGPDAEIALGLTESSTAGGTRLLPTLGFETIVGEIPDSSRGMASARSSKAVFGGSQVGALLLKSPYFVAPLKKRAIAGKPFADRISVGRARNNDIVLRDASISKFHAWFECDDDDAYYLGDARSKNTTSVNGALVAGPELLRLKPGDEIRFGNVETVLCPPELLWDALMAPGA
jgi:hypothetical protein